jgi:hypothetical protein
MAYEPRPVPDYLDTPIVQTSWYCLDCVFRGGTRITVANHWIVAHGDGEDKAANGIDIADGAHLILMRVRRQSWIDARADEFASEMYDGFTAEDFVAESEIRSA